MYCIFTDWSFKLCIIQSTDGPLTDLVSRKVEMWRICLLSPTNKTEAVQDVKLCRVILGGEAIHAREIRKSYPEIYLQGHFVQFCVFVFHSVSFFVILCHSVSFCVMFVILCNFVMLPFWDRKQFFFVLVNHYLKKN